MSINQANSHLHQRATATAWPRMRAAGFFFAVLASSVFSALASAAVVAPVKLPCAAATLNADDLVTIDDVLAEVNAPLELAAGAAMSSETTQDSDRKNNSSSEPTDSPLGGSEDAQQLNYGLLPVSSSTTGAGGAGSGGGGGSMMALSGAVAALLSADCTITRLVLADQLFPPSPPLCGIFHPPRALSSTTLCA